MSPQPPIVDVSALISPSAHPVELESVVQSLYSALHTWGFLQITGHGIPRPLTQSLYRACDDFFNLPEEDKLKLHVENGGFAWRGYMPAGGESTHGKTDLKEGVYCMPEHGADHPLFGLPLYGKNQFPDEKLPEMRPVVLEWIEKMTELGERLCDGLSLALGLPDEKWIREKYLRKPEPVALFRTFKYPGQEKGDDEARGIGEHSDFGLLTILKQHSPGLQCMAPDGKWVDVPVVEDALVINAGDMLDRLSGGHLKSAWHRVIPPEKGTYRISHPFFFDFGWNAEMVAFPLGSNLRKFSEDEQREIDERWAKTTFTAAEGVWGQYLGKKVQKVFPTLQLPDFEPNSKASSRFAIAIDPTKLG